MPDTSIRHNASVIPRSRVLQGWIDKPNLYEDSLEAGRPSRDLRLDHDPLKRNLVKPQIPKLLRRHLINQYREDILQLQDLIQRDLTAWLS